MIKFKGILCNAMKTFRIVKRNAEIEQYGKRPDVVSIAASLLLHAGILISILISLKIQSNTAKVNPPFVQVTTQDLNSKALTNSEKKYTLGKDLKSEKATRGNDKLNGIKTSVKEKELLANDSFYSLSSINADTSHLDQIYKEPTLNVTIKYPAGWTYVDQDLRNKLDGVTFWSNLGNYTPPPYVHLEVKDKDLFSASRYKFKLKMNGYTIYYNIPEKLEGQISQTFYIRTNSDEDFSFELIMEGEEAFKSFQPVFFGMIKSFKFGRSLF